VCAFNPSDTVRVVPLRCSLVQRGGTVTWDDLAQYPVTLRARQDIVVGTVCLAGNIGNTTTRPGRPLQVTITGSCTIRASVANVDDPPLLWRAAQLAPRLSD